MPLPSTSNKPLLLFFPFAHISNYKRCLSIAQHLRKKFTIQFLHTEHLAGLVYQEGYDTFSSSYFSFKKFGTIKKTLDIYEKNLENQFLEQVEILETLQPTLVINDGITTLSMASEFTGIPLVSLLNGFQSPYFAQHNTSSSTFHAIHGTYQVLREKYGLAEKQTFQEEMEGNLNWICDLPELFPQKALPSHYEIVGPILENVNKPTAKAIYQPNPLKMTIVIESQSVQQPHLLELLDKTYAENYNLIDTSIKNSSSYLKQLNTERRIYNDQLLYKTDLIFCHSECMLYKGLSFGIPIIFTGDALKHKCVIDALEYWNLGTSWERFNHFKEPIEYWVNNSNRDTLRTIQYKVKVASAILSQKLLSSIALHFPFIEKNYIAAY